MKTPVESMDSLIGPTVVIKGKVNVSQESLTIMGRVDGAIVLDQLLKIHERGDVNAEIRAQEVQVDGRLKGDIHGIEKVSISATGSVEGNIYARRFSVEEGASLKGSVIMGKEEESAGDRFRTKQPPRGVRKIEQASDSAGEQKLPDLTNDKVRV